MKKTSIRVLIALLILASLCATIHLHQISNELSANQPNVIKVLPEDPPVEVNLPEVEVVKTVLQKFLQL